MVWNHFHDSVNHGNFDNYYLLDHFVALVQRKPEMVSPLEKDISSDGPFFTLCRSHVRLYFPKRRTICFKTLRSLCLHVLLLSHRQYNLYTHKLTSLSFHELGRS